MTVLNDEDPADPSVHEPRVIDPPETVWLVYGDIEQDATHRECCANGEVMWCEDGQFSSDVRYLRADLLYTEARGIAAQQTTELREALAGVVNVLDRVRTQNDTRYHYAQGRDGAMVHVEQTIQAARALLKPNARLSGGPPGPSALNRQLGITFSEARKHEHDNND